MKTLAITLMMVLSFAAGIAQDWSSDPPNKNRMKKKVEDLRKMKLLEILDLSDDQVEKFFAVYNKHQKRILELRTKIDDGARDLQDMIKSGAADADLVAKSAEVRNNIKALSNEVDARFEAVKPVLKVNQYAKYVVFEARFYEELQKLVMERIKRKHRDD